MEFTRHKNGYDFITTGGHTYIASKGRNDEIKIFKVTDENQNLEDIAGKYFDKVKDIDTAMLRIVEDIDHDIELERFSRSTPHVSTSTPWGRAQGKTVFDHGISKYYTSSHGGFKVSNKLNQKIHPDWRNQDGWYEEDCEYAIVVATFPSLFTGKERRLADKALRDYFPDQYEKINRIVLQPGESYKKDERIFHELHREDYVVISAVGNDDGMVECCATKGGVRSEDAEERTFLVQKDEYRNRSFFEFVIDLERHEELENKSNSLTR